MKKHNIIKVLAVFFILLGVQKNVNAQIEQSVYINGIAPVGQLNNKLPYGANLLEKDNIGMEGLPGFGMGYRLAYNFDIGAGEISPFVSFDVFWNQIRSEYRNRYIQKDARVPNYLNMPLMLGVNYCYPFDDVIAPFAEFGIGYDFFKITAGGKKDTPEFTKYRVGGSFAWQLGLGCYFGHHFSVGIHYYNLGMHSINYKDPVGDNALRRIGEFALRLGFHF